MKRWMGWSLIVAMFALVSLTSAACGGAGDEAEEAAGSSAPVAEGEAGVAEDVASGAGQPSLDRKIIQTTSLDMQVEDVTEAYRETVRITLTAGGYVLESSADAEEEDPEADVTVRVPVAQYEDVVERLRGLAITVERETTQAEDVTEEYTDLQAQLRNAQALEVTYTGFLDRAQNIEEVLAVQDRLTQVRLEIERIQGRSNAIDTLTELATITLSLHSEPALEDEGEIDPLDAAGQAWEGSLITLRAIAAAALSTIVFLWWFLPLAAIGGGVALYVTRRGTDKET